MKRYKIAVKTINGVVLTFTVKGYSIQDGFVCFTDEKTGTGKKFHSSNCEIQEVE